MINRKEFLKGFCPTLAFAFFGVSFLEACSADSLEEGTDNVGISDNGGSSNNGYSKTGSTYTIDLTQLVFQAIMMN